VYIGRYDQVSVVNVILQCILLKSSRSQFDLWGYFISCNDVLHNELLWGDVIGLELHSVFKLRLLIDINLNYILPETLNVNC
jgi:hypothetical protein